MSFIPWDAALLIWKTANLIFLILSVAISLRLFAPGCSRGQRSEVWIFGLTMWPTISALFTGNTPLLILFATCAALLAMQVGKELLAGLALGIALCKPR